MATSAPKELIRKGTFVDLYAVTGITVGVQIRIQNIGNSDVQLSESVAEPDETVGFNILKPKEYVLNDSASVGAWAFSESGTTLQIEEA